MNVINSSQGLLNIAKNGIMGIEYPKKSRVINTSVNPQASSNDTCGNSYKKSGTINTSVK